METKPWRRHYDYSVPTTVRYPQMLIPELLGIPSNAFPDKAALTFLGSEMIFWELRQQVLRMGETVKAYIVLKPGETATAEEIITFCAERLAAYKVPKLVEFRASLPKSMIGKVLRKVLQAEEKAKSKT